MPAEWDNYPSSTTMDTQSMNAPANVQSFYGDDDFAEFCNYTPAFDDDPFDSQFGPMLNLNQDDSYDPSEQLFQTDDHAQTTTKHVKVEQIAASESQRGSYASVSSREELGPELEDDSFRRSKGVSPDQRDCMNEEPQMTINELHEQVERDEKNAEVDEWLSRSAAGSDAGQSPSRLSQDVECASIDQPSDLEQDPVTTADGFQLPRQESIQDLSDGLGGRFWADSPGNSGGTQPLHSQPLSSNAAISRFQQRAKDIETASRTATIGSRRRSLDSLWSTTAGITIRVPPPDPADSEQTRHRRTSLLQKVLPKRSNSSTKKRKGVQANDSPSSTAQDALWNENQSAGRTSNPWQKGTAQEHSHLTQTVSNPTPKSATSLAPPTTLWGHARNGIRRSRSRTDTDRPSSLISLWQSQGGPPVPTLRSPVPDDPGSPTIASVPRGRGVENTDRDGDVDEEGDLIYDVEALAIPASATYEGFQEHAQELTPQLSPVLLERLVQEQMRRYKKLIAFRVDHLAATSTGVCKSADQCMDQGGAPIVSGPSTHGYAMEGSLMSFHIPQNFPDRNGESIDDGLTMAAHFPRGVPAPPVQYLPAKFECPLCFQVKNIAKPSDWTKHVHEDVQPFTCTFMDCGEPKSFKRKADWVRHENERHRQLEKWECDFDECTHVCYRKDNFVQHLVREHRLPELPTRGKQSVSGDNSVTAQAVKRCHSETDKDPRQEPCRFCGARCDTWKKLTVHLARHMEELSMPVLQLVEDAEVTLETVVSPLQERATSLRPSAASPTSRSPVARSPRTASPHSSTSRQHGIEKKPPASRIQTSANAAVTHTYPPPSINVRTASLHVPGQSGQFGATLDPATVPVNFAMYHDYPGLTTGGSRDTFNSLPQQTLSQSANQYLSPVDSANHSYGSSGSSNAFYDFPDQNLSAEQQEQYMPEVDPTQAMTYSDQGMYTSPVDGNYPFPFDEGDMSQSYASNASSYTHGGGFTEVGTAFPSGSNVTSGAATYPPQQMPYATAFANNSKSVAFAASGAAYASLSSTAIQDQQQQMFHGSTYPPQHLAVPRRSSPLLSVSPPVQTVYMAQGQNSGQRHGQDQSHGQGQGQGQYYMG